MSGYRTISFICFFCDRENSTIFFMVYI